MPASAGNPVTCWKKILRDSGARLKDRLLALEKIQNPSRRLLYGIASAPETPSKLKVAANLLLEELVTKRAKATIEKMKKESSGQ